MGKRMHWISCLLVGLVFVAACGDSATESTEESAPTVTLGTSLKQVMSTSSSLMSEAIPTGAALAVSLAKPISQRSQSFSATALSSDQFSTSLNLGALSYFTTPATYIDYILNKTADTDPSDGMGLVNRFKQKVTSGMCPIIAMFPDADSNGIPDIGAGTITVPDFADASVVATFTDICPDLIAENFTEAAGMTVSYAFTDISQESGSKYDIKGAITVGQNPDYFFYKADGNVIRFMYVETQGSASTDAGEFVFFEYDKTNVRFEMHSGNQDGHYRMLYNTTTKDITMYAHVCNETNEAAAADKRIYMGIVGNRANSVAAVTISADATGLSHDSLVNGQACVELSGATSAWDSAPVAGKCGTIDVIDFETEPAVATASFSYAGTVGDLVQTFAPSFTNRAEVFSTDIF